MYLFTFLVDRVCGRYYGTKWYGTKFLKVHIIIEKGLGLLEWIASQTLHQNL